MLDYPVPHVDIDAVTTKRDRLQAILDAPQTALWGLCWSCHNERNTEALAELAAGVPS